MFEILPELTNSLVMVLLSVLFAVGPLRGVHPAVCVRLEVLPQAGAGGEALAAGLTSVRLVACDWSVVEMQASNWSDGKIAGF